MKRVALYLRVSTSSKKNDEYRQNLEVQEKPLLELVNRAGWKVQKIYADRMSGASIERPQFKAMMEDARRREFDIVLCWKFDRIARSVKELISVLDELRGMGIEFVSHTEALDTSTPIGRMFFQVVAAMAEFERSLIRERVKAGVHYAMKHGSRSGNPIGRPKRIFRRDEIPALIDQGVSLRQIARRFGVGLGTIQRELYRKANEESAG